MKINIKIALILLFLVFAVNAAAKDKANIYAFSRDVPQKEIIGES